ncbi:ADP-ribosylation factor-like protein 6-interacting protein 4 [Geranomyces variabilis]|nr:ADP-ribosylation factor-like protein 6-interacting protein 4 [Geranomyces variabilis]
MSTGVLDLVENRLGEGDRSAARLGPPAATEAAKPRSRDGHASPVAALAVDGTGQLKAQRRRPPAVPQTRAEFEAEQSVVREVFDPLTGRTRLVKGSGEIIEKIVTKAQHRLINQTATREDGAGYAATLGNLAAAPARH